MRHRFGLIVGACALALAVAAVPAPLAGQAPPRARAGKSSTSLKTPDGYPDVQGTYNVATLTPLERADQKDVLSEDEAVAIEKAEASRRERANRPSRGDRVAPPKGGDGSTGASGQVGGYNNFW